MRDIGNIPGNLDPWAVTLDPVNQIGNSADDARFTLGNLSQPDPTAAFAWTDGVFPSAMASGQVLDLQVSPTTPTPSFAVTIHWGGAQVGRSLHGPYLCTSTINQSVSFSAPSATNPRIDYVVMRTADPGLDPTPTRSWFPVVLQGVPGASPLEPTSQITDADLLLAAVTIRPGASQVLSGDIADRRVFAAARGGAYLKSAVDNRPGAFPGMLRYNLAGASYETWNAAANAWVPVVPSAPWITYTPTLQTTNGNTVYLGGGGFSSGRYQITGKICHVYMYFEWGSAPWNGGSGIVWSPLPNNILSVNHRTQWVQAHLWVKNNVMIADFHGQGAVYPNFNSITPWFVKSRSDNSTETYKISTSPGAAGTGVPLVPGGFPEGGQLIINGEFEIQ